MARCIGPIRSRCNGSRCDEVAPAIAVMTHSDRAAAASVLDRPRVITEKGTQHLDSPSRERRVANLPRSGKVVDEARWAESMRAGERPGERRLLRRNAPRRVFMTPLRSGEVTPDETCAFCSLPAVRGAASDRNRLLLDPARGCVRSGGGPCRMNVIG